MIESRFKNFLLKNVLPGVILVTALIVCIIFGAKLIDVLDSYPLLYDTPTSNRVLVCVDSTPEIVFSEIRRQGEKILYPETVYTTYIFKYVDSLEAMRRGYRLFSSWAETADSGDTANINICPMRLRTFNGEQK